ncbi:MAG: S-layer homology domain-containing protein [Bifidobacteriaceae bacterium]|jgi:hypothetical protein|nr:S-layer homology domain-containing protein [Bifidobacteriaceae bacterium]
MGARVRRSAALLLCCALAAGLPAPASAGAEAALSVSGAAGVPGETLRISVNLSGNPGIWGLMFDLSYDRTRLSLLSCEAGTLFALPVLPQDINTVPVKFSLENESLSENVTADGVLLHLTFRVNDDASNGRAGVTVSNAKGANVDLEKITLPDASGAVVVTGGVQAQNGDAASAADGVRDSVEMPAAPSDPATEPPGASVTTNPSVPGLDATPAETTAPDRDFGEPPAPESASAPAQTPSLAPRTNPFADIDPGAWYGDAVRFVTERGLFKGLSDSAFAPNAVMTRAMLITVLARMSGVDTAAGEHWYSAAVEWGVETGVTDGAALQDTVTREQIATMLYRLADGHAAALSPQEAAEADALLAGFTDARNLSEWALPAMRRAVDAGIVRGRDAELAPKSQATRAEVAAMLQRHIENEEEE